MDGKIVQLVQGTKKALEFANFADWVERFKKYPLVQLVDLDAAMGKGDNGDLVATLCRLLPCQVGGGIRSVEAADAALAAGAKKVILGSALIRNGAVDTGFVSKIRQRVAPEQLVAAIDSRDGKVAIHGWKTLSSITPAEMIHALEHHVSAFLYTHIDTEGMLQGIALDVVRDLKQQTARKVIAAGGIRSQAEIDELDAMGVDAVVGMAIY